MNVMANITTNATITGSEKDSVWPDEVGNKAMMTSKKNKQSSIFRQHEKVRNAKETYVWGAKEEHTNNTKEEWQVGNEEEYK